jgi:prepilin-type N-terminal cleavage/methylation domain-containing protein
MRNLMSKKANAFTLIEILVVILIIGLLFVFLVPKISNATDKAREVGVKNTFHSYETAFESVMKERSGLGENSVTNATTLIGYINGYLDPALKIDKAATTKDADTAGAEAATDEGTAAVYLTSKADPWNNKYVFVCSLSDGKGTENKTTSNANDGAVMVYTRGKDAAPSMQLGYIAGIDKSSANLGVEKAGDDYALVCAYLDGVEYTATVGFSTDIAAK